MMARRVVLDGVLSPDECDQLVYIARCLSVVGYRAAVASCTCFEVAAAEPALLLPLMAAREKVRAAVEEGLGIELGLLVEFTGLISWRPGAAIDFHHDANRPYLQQRHYSAVAYLNTAGSDFGGGAFQFQQGSPAQVLPAPGRVVAYSAQDVHGVQPVREFGERFTLTVWFTTDPEHNEDPKLLARLTARYCTPQGLPSTMYRLPGGAGDLGLCRLAMMGFGLLPSSHQGQATSTLSGTSGGSGSGSHGHADGPVQLVVGLQRLAAWQGSEMAARARSTWKEGGEGICQQQEQEQHGQQRLPCSPGAVMPMGIEFASLEQAVPALQFWAWKQQQRRQVRSCEDACHKHLWEEEGNVGDASAATDCAWVAMLSQQQLAVSAERCEGDGLAELCREVQEASVAVREYLEGLRRRYDDVVGEWIQLGAVF